MYGCLPLSTIFQRGEKIIDIVHWLSYRYPHLKKRLSMAHLKETADEFIYKNLKSSLLLSFLFTILLFFVVDKAKLSKFLLIPVFMVMFFLFFNFNFLRIKGRIKKRERETNKEVLYLGNYLLVKLYSGRPLLNALMETSQSRGVAAKYIKEIVDDIDTGRPIEQALSRAILYSPSEKFKKILFQINNALKIGIDVTKPLESAIDEIAQEQEIEVKKYGKKLNTIIVFYMLMAVVVPSVGMTMFIVLASFINLQIKLEGLFVIVFFIALVQLVFISMFKSIRPMVNI
ncbi:type II secretion system F family protein [Candidatus Woesearchaeota archaeon]|nr:type II secretion system F family protein [Candidatus Woesearchaeota archaeon]